MTGLRRRAAVLRGVGAAGAAGGPLAVACGLGAGGAAPQEAPPAQIRPGSTISFWPGIGGSYASVVDAWSATMQQRTGVKVESTTIANLVEFDTKLATAFAGGTPPDVFRYRPDAVSIIKVVEQGWLLRLDELIKRDRYDLTDFRKDALELYRWRGGLHAVPRDYGLQFIYYNAELFQREGLPPLPTDWNDRTWTYEKFLEVCLRLTRPDGERYAVLAPRGGRPGASFIYSNGGALARQDAQGRATEIALTEPAAYEGLQFVQDLMYRYRVAPPPSQEAALGAPLAAMQAGRLAMRVSNPSTNREYLTSGMPYDVGVFPLGKARRRSVGGGGTSWAVTGPSKAVDEAWAFTSYIAGREGVLVEVDGGHTNPSRVSVITGKEFLDPTKPPSGKRVYVDGQEFVQREPLHPKWPDVEREVVNPLLNEKVWSNQSPASQVVKEIKEKGDAFLRG